MERVNNNEFKSKSLPQRTQYLKDCDDDNATSFRMVNGKLKVLIGLSSTLVAMFLGYFIDLILGGL